MVVLLKFKYNTTTLPIYVFSHLIMFIRWCLSRRVVRFFFFSHIEATYPSFRRARFFLLATHVFLHFVRDADLFRHLHDQTRGSWSCYGRGFVCLCTYSWLRGRVPRFRSGTMLVWHCVSRIKKKSPGRLDLGILATGVSATEVSATGILVRAIRTAAILAGFIQIACLCRSSNT